MLKNEFDFRSEAQKCFDSIKFMAREAGLQRNRRIQATLRVIASNPGDTKTVKEVTQQAMEYITKTPSFKQAMRDQNPFQPYPSHSLAGPIKIGKVFNPRSPIVNFFGLSLQEINEHMFITGRSGIGKTTTFFIILANLVRLKIPFLIIDLKKDYRHLIRHIPNLLVFTWRDFKFNPLQPPPGTDVFYWIQYFVEIFFECFFPDSAPASKSAALEFLEKVYAKTKETYGDHAIPSLFDVYDALKKETGNSSLQSTYRARLHTLESRIRPLLRMLGPMLDCQRGYPLEDLLNCNVVLELDGMTLENQDFTVNQFLYSILSYRLQKGQRNRLLHVCLFDECKRVFGKEKASGNSMISHLVATAREFGEAIVSGDQMPSAIGRAIMANCYTKIVLNLSDPHDMKAMASALGLNPAQCRQLSRLPKGLGIVKLAGRYPEPFLIQIPNYPIVKDVTDRELEQYMAPHLASLHFQPRSSPEEEVYGDEFSPDKPDEEATVEPNQEPLQDPPLEESLGLSETEFMFLMDVKNRPFETIVSRYRSLKLTNYMGNKVKRILIEKEYLEEIKILLVRGNVEKYMKFTALAEEKIGKQNLGSGKGGFEHVLWQNRFDKYFEEQGFQTKIEEYKNGKGVDVGLSRNGDSIALEVEMSSQGAVSNIIKDFEAGWSQIWVACQNRQIQKEIQAQWEDKKSLVPGAQVQFYLVSELLADSNGKPKGKNENK